MDETKEEHETSFVEQVAANEGTKATNSSRKNELLDNPEIELGEINNTQEYDKNSTTNDEIDEIISKANSLSHQNNFPPNSLTFPKSGLDDIIEEEKDINTSNSHPQTRSTSSKSKQGPPSGKASPDRPSTLPKSRVGNGGRSARWSYDYDVLPNTSSTIYSPIGPSRGVSEFDQPEQWSNSRGSNDFISPLTSPAFSPSPALSPDLGHRPRVQIKNHGPVAKWLAKRQKKRKDYSPKDQSKQRRHKNYAPHIQPKVDTRNDDYSPRGGDIPPVLSEKLTWNAKPMVQTHNDVYIKEHKKPFTVMNDKLHWDAKPKVENWNKDYKPKPTAKFQVFSEKLQWYEQPKLDTINRHYIPAGQNNKPVPIVNEDIQWSSISKIDTHNKGYKPPTLRDSPVFHENIKWKAAPKVDNQRPHYRPSISLGAKVKTDKLNWKKESKIDTFNPKYIKGKGNAKVLNNNSKYQRENNSGWSSHSSDSETEWYNSLPGSGQAVSLKSPEPFFRQSKKLLFKSKDIVGESKQPLANHNIYEYSRTRSNSDPLSNDTGKTHKPFSTYSPRESRVRAKTEKPKKLFKERIDPLPPIGSYAHQAKEPVVYSESRRFGSYHKPRPQKIEVIGMEDLSLITKRERYSVFIN